MHRCAWLLSLALAALRITDVADFARAETPGPVEKQARHVGSPKQRSSQKQVFCGSDKDCPKRHFCPLQDLRHANSLGPPPPRCTPCKKRGKRCHRDQMCCPGNTCRHCE
ncbi:hypothetical protein ACEWY4_025109 [Coilia grayii]|uniref:Dickkopf N-terminal cysteine-rich domain-containing protein n=1 Tax=Coilia grayii TaxID=363190 RepID=A0ABD1IZ93_9TELE